MRENHGVHSIILYPEGKLQEEPFCREDFRYDGGKPALEEGEEVQRL